MKINIGEAPSIQLLVQPPPVQPQPPPSIPPVPSPSTTPGMVQGVIYSVKGRTLHFSWKPPLKLGDPPFWTYEVIYYGFVPRGKSGGVSGGYYTTASSADIAISDPNVNHVEVIIMAISASGKGSPYVAEIDMPVGPQPWSGQHPGSGFRIVG